MGAPILTIDGPSGAGKGTISRLMAKHLGWHYLDSGSLYRALAISLKDKTIATDDCPQVVTAAAQLDLQFECAETLKVKLEDQDISDQLNYEEVGVLASKIAAIPEVRSALLQKQHDFQQFPGLVADGRDMGTVVFPAAKHKIFLTASIEERARRRYKQLIEKGIGASLAKIMQDIKHRDLQDQQRATAPLVLVEDMFYIDSSAMAIEAVIARINRHIS